ncbi:prepilin peptidase [Candidatus Parcubacteria bacterium]|nr:prepilin peptidase [Patescibacteria group bacterium]MBU4309272.1 prepilin peptidase [Patescibacteria group bacterium]MBU4432501.1 prepilin peptidase [Patescibacteria group bacterium]MBU4577633.1 prepilin peptidase [Patescibacteria group bacterium]MCG2697319.1 prepilin peptidase [Candidatus Parcubacteria bacterium]
MDYSIFSFFALLFGLIIGSFLNALIWRLHTGESMMERSKCPKCGKAIAWYDNVPVLSYLFLLGKCRGCKMRISFQYPLVELITGLLFMLAFNFSARGGSVLGGQLPNYIFFITLFRDFFLISTMIIVFIYDLRWYLILDVITLPSIAVLFVLNLVLGISWQSLLLSGIIGGGFFLLQFIISKGKWIGGGDIRLGFLMGIALGWPQIITALMLAYIAGAFIGIGLIVFGKKKWSSHVPFGVFLSVATIVTLFWGDPLLRWYFGFIGV